jgi:hypothetical protein
VGNYSVPIDYVRRRYRQEPGMAIAVARTEIDPEPQVSIPYRIR